MADPSSPEFREAYGALQQFAAGLTTPPEHHLDDLARETEATQESPQMLTGPVEGRLLETIASLDGPFDLVFIDADKDGYVDYEAVLPRLAPRGLIVADNTLQGGRALSEGPIKAFNEHVACDPRTVQVLLTVRDGVTLIRRA